LTNYLLGLELRASNFFFNALRRSQNINKTEIIRRAIIPTVKPANCCTERDLPLCPADDVAKLEYSPEIKNVQEQCRRHCVVTCVVFGQTRATINSTK